jgi:hypothetical protein
LIITLTSRVPERSPPVTPRTPMEGDVPLSIRYRPGTLSSASATDCHPFWMIWRPADEHQVGRRGGPLLHLPAAAGDGGQAQQLLEAHRPQLVDTRL